MSLTRYETKDYAISTLLTGLSSSATSLQSQTWEWSNFPKTSNGRQFILTLEKITTTDGIEVVDKREKVLVTARNGDQMTIERAFDGSSAQSFSVGDRLTVMNNAIIMTKLQDEVENLWTTKLDKIWGTREWLWGDKILRTNAAWEETEISLPNDSGVYLNGEGNFWAPPVDVNWQTSVTTVDRVNDYVVISDASNGGATRKVRVNTIAPLATEALQWLAQKATNSEVNVGTNSTKYITPSQSFRVGWERYAVEWTNRQYFVWVALTIGTFTPARTGYYKASVRVWPQDTNRWSNRWFYVPLLWILQTDISDNWNAETYTGNTWLLTAWQSYDIVFTWESTAMRFYIDQLKIWAELSPPSIWTYVETP